MSEKRLSFAWAISLALLWAGVANAGITGAAGIGDITFHSSFFADGMIFPSYTTGSAAIPRYAGALSHEVMAPGAAEHSYMAMTWDFDNASPNPLSVFIPNPTSLADATKLDLIPHPPVPAHHSATMTGTFSVIYALDAGGLPSVTLPARTYTLYSYIDPYPPVPFRTSSASFEAHWDYTDVDSALYLGSQDITYAAPVGFGVIGSASSAPLTIYVPAGNTALKVSGYFKLTADSDDASGFTPSPYDTMITLVPEPATMSLLALGGLALARMRRRRA